MVAVTKRDKTKESCPTCRRGAGTADGTPGKGVEELGADSDAAPQFRSQSLLGYKGTSCGIISSGGDAARPRVKPAASYAMGKAGWSVVPSSVVSHKGTKYRMTIRVDGNVFMRLETHVKPVEDGSGKGWQPVGDAQGLMVAQKD